VAEIIEGATVKIGGDIGALRTALGQIPTAIGDALRNTEGVFRDATGRMHDELSGQFVKVESLFDSLGSKVAPKLQSMGTALTGMLTVPIVGAGLAIAKFGGDFEAAMTRVAVLGDVSGKELEELNAQAIKLGIETPYSAKQAADAMGEFAAQGFKANEIMVAMPGILGLAASGQVSTGVAAQATADILRGYGLEASKAAMISDVLAKAAADSAIGVVDAANAFKYIGPVASAAGVSFHETAAALMILADAGIRGEKAGTGVQQFLIDLVKPSKAAAAAIEDMGIKLKDAHGKFLPLPMIVEQFSQAQKKAGDGTTFLAEATKIWGMRAADVLPLIKAGGESLAKHTEELKNSEGASKKMGDALMNNLKGSMEQLKGSLETLAIALFKTFGPVMKEVVDSITKATNWLIEMAKELRDQPQWLKNFEVGLLAVFAVAGPVLLGMGVFFKALVDIKSGLMLLSGVFPAFSGAAATATTAVGGLAGALTLLKGAVVIAAAAFVAWELGSWAYKNIAPVKALGDALSGLILKMPGVQEMIDRIGGIPQANKQFADSVTVLEARLKAKGVTVDKTNLSLEEYSRKLREAVAKLSPVKTETDRVEIATGAWKKSFDGLMGSIGTGGGTLSTHTGKVTDAEKAHKTLETQIKGVQDHFEQFIAKFNGAAWDFSRFQQFEKEGGNVKRAVSEIDAELLKLRQKFDGELPPAIKGTIVQMLVVKDALLEFKRVSETAKLDQAWVDLNKEIAKTPKVIEDMSPIIRDMINKDLEAPLKKAEGAFGSLGKAAGESANTIQGERKGAAQKSTTAWDGFTKQVSTILSDFAKSSAEGLWKIFSNKQNDELKKQERDLQASLADRTKGWEAYQKELALKMEGMTEMEKSEAIALFAMKEQEYKKYLADVQVKLEDLKSKHKSAFSAIGGFFTSLLSDMGKALTRWGIETVIGAIQKSFKDAFAGVIADSGAFGIFKKALSGLIKHITDAFGGVSKTIADVFKTAIPTVPTGGTGGTKGGTPGTGGTGGTGSLGLVGGIDLVTSIVQAAMAVLGYVQQRHMEADIAKIEVTSRGVLNQILSIQDDVNTYWPHLANLPAQLARLDIIESAVVWMRDAQLPYLQELRDEIVWIKENSFQYIVDHIDTVASNTMAIYETLRERLPVPTSEELALTDLASGTVVAGGVQIGEINISGIQSDDPLAFADAIIGTVMDALAPA